VEAARRRGPIPPSDVLHAGPAEGDLPAESPEPGVLLGWSPPVDAAGGLPEAADFENDPPGVGKGVGVGAVDLDPVGNPGDGLGTAAAPEPTLLTGFPGGGLIEDFRFGDEPDLPVVFEGHPAKLQAHPLGGQVVAVFAGRQGFRD